MYCMIFIRCIYQQITHAFNHKLISILISESQNLQAAMEPMKVREKWYHIYVSPKPIYTGEYF
ncbi:TPA: hypothetical protein ACSPJ7_005602 [Bacillus cereus]